MPEETTPNRVEPSQQTKGPKKAPHQESGCQRDGRGRRHPRRPLVYAERTGLDPAISEDGDLCGGIHRPLSGVVFPTIGAGLLHLDPELGHYLFVALDPESKLIPTFLVGKRDTDTAHRFTQAPRACLNGNGRIQLTTDGLRAYPPAVEEAFGNDGDSAQLVRCAGPSRQGTGGTPHHGSRRWYPRQSGETLIRPGYAPAKWSGRT